MYYRANIMKITGAGVILNNKGSYLLVSETKFGFPKGHVEAVDKSGIDCATRELYEETGVVAKIPKTAKYWISRQKSYIYYLVDVDDGGVVLPETLGPTKNHGEVLEIGWFTPTQILAMSKDDANTDLRDYFGIHS